MKVLNEREAFLLDYEILQHLTGIKEKFSWSFTPEDDANDKYRRKRFAGAGQGLEAITRDILLYLAKNAAGSVTSEASFGELVTFLNAFDLMKAEKLQIVNSLPRSMVHLYGLVEECDLRFDEDTCQSIIDKIDELFPLAQEEGEEEENEAEDDAMADS
ncbi:hypothetical protein METBIDRAFT_46707 [Metschnikowia bicuspidata var. bicuspidata NRRL YB-4993]|uniref:DNA-directed RNA polymerase III subunit RPC9 n=1 Tax=Metschnikowia bicuspidata var. bicuspidata NRRL YB-4993 TaxID=869754 RepID=A0A1A0H5Z9_9ASCO|nr:hypothetical protein METBIDRAFT_46707 [Metschnikowia bicuspidata var. bicuspidata NRRL YB-4993]OBA19332.1 hypothetical protein METBIDRAFT_46707 [Metschnikowia bicuspidata var. bicuspidata NRRL YB-4993]